MSASRVKNEPSSVFLWSVFGHSANTWPHTKVDNPWHTVLIITEGLQIEGCYRFKNQTFLETIAAKCPLGLFQIHPRANQRVIT